MPKGRAPSMLSMNNGPLAFITSKNASDCHRCKCRIAGRTACAELPVFQSGFKTPKRVCLACAASIVATTQEDLDKLRAQLPA